ncbi:hypothetical protein CC1G_08787 [Coprinopsis cinerea okayama7|uniref:Uncharacterized protein n=1 Tax=Coprinopsis cinerea (strain Okayama-7 / 130 / ATCC MYA-4618 / FGSC 9003) TaxID=240176 RepID=A8N437_COPC7|nr:hypothetical protein CC1G_08787 [Coprinopsis cinerea okayama7\|eukprot:XP_001829632.2 hypothetical protein CC1G_08787 [Coprinopsis cinerea okayama7\
MPVQTRGMKSANQANDAAPTNTGPGTAGNANTAASTGSRAPSKEGDKRSSGKGPGKPSRVAASETDGTGSTKSAAADSTSESTDNSADSLDGLLDGFRSLNVEGGDEDTSGNTNTAALTGSRAPSNEGAKRSSGKGPGKPSRVAGSETDGTGSAKSTAVDSTAKSTDNPAELGGLLDQFRSLTVRGGDDGKSNVERGDEDELSVEWLQIEPSPDDIQKVEGPAADLYTNFLTLTGLGNPGAAGHTTNASRMFSLWKDGIRKTAKEIATHMLSFAETAKRKSTNTAIRFLSFSNARPADLKELGVLEVTMCQLDERLMRKIKFELTERLSRKEQLKFAYEKIVSNTDKEFTLTDKNRQLEVILTRVWEDCGTKAILATFNDYVGTTNEARARIVIDHILVLTINVIKMTLVYESAPIMFPEFEIARKGTQGPTAPVVIEYQDNTFACSGRMDYVLVNASPDERPLIIRENTMYDVRVELRAARERKAKAGVVEGKGKGRKKTGGKDTEAKVTRQTPRICIIEAKRYEGETALMSHLPQVIVQSIASMATFNRSIETTPWVLTNGIYWIFGGTFFISATKTYEVRHLPIQSILQTTSGSNQQASGISQSKLREVVTQLMTWNTNVGSCLFHWLPLFSDVRKSPSLLRLFTLLDDLSSSHILIRFTV